MMENYHLWNEFQWEQFLRNEERLREKLIEYAIRTRTNPSIVKSIIQKDFFRENTSEGWDEGEEWKENTDRELLSENWRLSTLRCYCSTMETIIALKSSLRISAFKRNNLTLYVDIMAHAVGIKEYIAKGMYLKDELECPGGAIAYCKRALNSANRLIGNLSECFRDGIVGVYSYMNLQKKATDTRNEIGCYIIDLRNDFKSFSKNSVS